MSGPIVRTGPTPQFTQNWDSVFGKKSGKAAATKSAKAAKSAKPAKAAKAAKAVKKAAKKKKAGK
jgi:hypothetical protein